MKEIKHIEITRLDNLPFVKGRLLIENIRFGNHPIENIRFGNHPIENIRFGNLPFLKRRGQTSLEALLVLVFFIAILCFGISLMKGKLNLAEESLNALNAKSNAIACSILLNSFYSNSAEEIQEFNANCSFGKESEVIGLFEGKKKNAFCLTKGKILSKNQGKELLVEKLEHYGGIE